ncbi:unnamed protein product [Hydatigera taeniaeformis]|uniref:Transmembrane protein n=1 Tax=Hydatigena taeniaeformis TaxID=6205 RepID=A0A0R3WL83_HYDTA|nr:unnamed protein product [Hydatigera taeniaeformis]
MEENLSEVELPRRRISRHPKPVKRPAKRQLQQSYRLSSNRSQPQGDEASVTQSQIHSQVQEQTEFNTQSTEKEQKSKPPEGNEVAPTATLEGTEVTKEVSFLQGKTIIIAIERNDHVVDLSQCVEDLDLDRLKPQHICDLVCKDGFSSISMEAFLSRVPTGIAELITQRRGIELKENILFQFESFNKASKKSFLNASSSPMTADCVLSVNFASPKYESMKLTEVAKNKDERTYIFASHLIIASSAHALPLPKMIADYIPKQAAFSVTRNNSTGRISVEKQTMNCAELHSWEWVEASPVRSTQYHHICMCDDDLIGEEALEGELEVSLLGFPVISTSMIVESSLANGLDSYSCSCSSSALTTDSSTISSTSTASTTTTNFWMLVGNPPILETEEISEMDDTTARSACSLTRTEMRQMSMRWATGSCFFLSALFVVKCYCAELLRGDWLSIAGIVSALCTIVLISLSRHPSAS